MNIVNKLTLRHLKENKSRTVITTLGICVSVAMITAVFVAVASILNFFGEISYMKDGHIDAYMTVNDYQLTELMKDERLSTVGVNTAPDDYIAYQVQSDSPYSKCTGDFYWGDETNLIQMFTGEYSGEIPKNEHEIAVEQSFIDDNKLNWKIGDTVKIPVGLRQYNDNGETVVTGGAYVNGEEFIKSAVNEYKITAILKDNPATMDNYKIICGLDLNNLNLKDDNTVTATVQLKNANSKSLVTLKDIAKSHNISGYVVSKDYLESKLAFDKNGTFITTIMPMCLIVLTIIIVASVVLIYNAFAMSLSERVRYLGMLASVGATKKQKKMSVYYEGFILGAVGIPIGILAGVLGISITLKATGDKIIQTGMLNGITSENLTMKTVVPVWAIIGVVLFSALTIFISSFIPSVKASSVTPIDAIRQRQEIKVKAKKLKSPKIIRKIFGYEGELAYKNLKRNGRKGRVIIASIALSVILFLSCNSFCQLFVQEIDLESQVPYQISTFVSIDEKDKFLNDIKNTPDVDDYFSINFDYVILQKNDTSQPVANKKYLTSAYKNMFASKSHFYINYIDDEDFNQLCKNNSIDYTQFYGSETKGVLMNNITHKNFGSAVFNSDVIGQKFEDVEIAGLVNYDSNNYVCNLNAAKTVSIYIPVSKCTNDLYYSVGIVTEHHESVAEEIRNIASGKYSQFGLTDFVEFMQSMNTFVFVMEVFIYGFIVLITLITIANIINTISTGIMMRRKEFAMLKSVGTTPIGFRKMIVLESVFYGLKALVVALPVSVAINYLMYSQVGTQSVPFEINWLLYLATVVVVFVIIGISMLFSVRKLRNDSIVETLKEEIN